MVKITLHFDGDSSFEYYFALRDTLKADIEESIVEGKIEFSADKNSITITADSLDYIAIDIHNETTVWITFWREEWEFSWLTSFSVTF